MNLNTGTKDYISNSSFGRSERFDNTSPLTIDFETCGKYQGEMRIDREVCYSGKSIDICI
jgi:hypothetical protein